MTHKQLYKAAQLLKAGQVVKISGDYFQAVRLPEKFEWSVCQYCDLDSICKGDVHEVCAELDVLPNQHWILKLAHPL